MKQRIEKLLRRNGRSQPKPVPAPIAPIAEPWQALIKFDPANPLEPELTILNGRVRNVRDIAMTLQILRDAVLESQVRAIVAAETRQQQQAAQAQAAQTAQAQDAAVAPAQVPQPIPAPVSP